jgi:hypothetical protein
MSGSPFFREAGQVVVADRDPQRIDITGGSGREQPAVPACPLP